MGAILRGDLFAGYRVLQEYPVSRINPLFSSNRERVDWVIQDLNVAIEVQGQQHTQAITFGGMRPSEAEKKLEGQQKRDCLKKEAIESVGWTYISVDYRDILTLTDTDLLERIISARTETSRMRNGESPSQSSPTSSGRNGSLVRPKSFSLQKHRVSGTNEAWKKAQKERAKAFRKCTYRILRRLRKKLSVS